MKKAKLVKESLDDHNYEPHVDDNNGYSSENWVLQEGDEIIFALRGMHSEWKDEGKETYNIACKHDGKRALIMNQVCASEIGNLDGEYYDIKFEDGEILYAVSGFHLIEQ